MIGKLHPFGMLIGSAPSLSGSKPSESIATNGYPPNSGDATKKSEGKKKKQNATLSFAVPGSVMHRPISLENDGKVLHPTSQVSVTASPPPVGILPAMDLPSQEVEHRIPRVLGEGHILMTTNPATLPWIVSSMIWILTVETKTEIETETILVRGREN